MATDWDLTDDMCTEQTAKNAGAGTKFQPKARKGPKKQSSASIPSTQPVQPHNSSGDGSGNSVDKSLASFELPDTEKQVETNSDMSLRIHSSDHSMLVNSATEHFEIGETRIDNDGLHSESEIVGGDLHFIAGKSSGEVTDIFVGLESLHDIYPESTIAAVGAANRSPDRVLLDVQLANESATSFSANNDAGSSVPPPGVASVSFSDNQGAEEEHITPLVSPPDNSVRILEPSSANTHPEVSAADPLISGEAVISNSDRGSEIERAEATFSAGNLDNSYDLTSLAGQRTGKFQPKPKIHTDKVKHTRVNSQPNGTESIQYFQDEQSLCYDPEIMYEGSIPLGTTLNSHSLAASDFTSEHPVNEEMVKFVDDSLADAFNPEDHLESFPEILEEVSGSTMCGTTTPLVSNDNLEQQNAFVSGEEDGTSRSLRQLRKRKNSYNLIDESDGEANQDMDTYECPIGDLTNEDGNDDNECPAPDVTLNRKAWKKSNKDAPQKKQPVRKRKKVNAVEDQPTKEPPKKRFPHSTRKKRRQVDKALLETPEEDIDLSKLPIRDIILLAEHRERMMSKEKVPEPPSTSQSAGANSFFEHNEDETFGSEQGDEFGDDQPNPVVQEASHTNYHSFMNKTPRSRWTKQDTELFYEGVEQFGSDISMIQQLFPGRTRAQVKLKYKKEERQNPLRLDDALRGGRKDHSHFQGVIERLKELAAQEKQNSYKEDPIDLSGGEETNHENNDKVGNPDKVDEEEAGEVEAVEPDVVTDIQSPVKTYNSEDEMAQWDHYTGFD